MTKSPGPTYYVEKNRTNDRWRILRIDQGCSVGCIIADHYKRRCEAMTAAGLLAGWRGHVVLVKAMRRAG